MGAITDNEYKSKKDILLKDMQWYSYVTAVYKVGFTQANSSYVHRNIVNNEKK
jgi:hypothetical protein